MLNPDAPEFDYRTRSSVAELYLANTKLYSGRRLGAGEEDPIAAANAEAILLAGAVTEEAVAAGGKVYRSFPVVPLPPPISVEDRSLGEVLANRQSTRDFDPARPVGLDALGTVLYYSYGWRPGDPPHKFTPAAGRLYALEVYAVALNTAGLEAGTAYHYRPTGHSLEKLTRFDGPPGRVLGSSPWVDQAAAILVFTGVLGRVRWKYGERGLRYMLLEAGHAAQNACLVCGALGVGVCPVADYLDDELHDRLDLDGVSEAVINVLVLGTPSREPAGTQ